MINVGDKVKIKYINRQDRAEYPHGWDDEMDKTIGEIGIVEERWPDCYRVGFAISNWSWAYRLDDVELVRRIVTPKLVQCTK